MDKVFRALADPTRRKVLELLRRGPMTAGELCDHFESARPTLSAHFSVLKEANLVEAHRDGKQIIYQLKLSVLEEALLGFAGMFRLGDDTPAPSAGELESKI